MESLDTGNFGKWSYNEIVCVCVWGWGGGGCDLRIDNDN